MRQTVIAALLLLLGCSPKPPADPMTCTEYLLVPTVTDAGSMVLSAVASRPCR